MEPRTDAVAFGSGWRILGWRMADGSLLCGDVEQFDEIVAALLDVIARYRKDCVAIIAPHARR